MKIPKCPKTITGNHFFYLDRDNPDNIIWIKIKDGCRADFVERCQICGIVDDSKLSVTIGGLKK